MKKGLLFFTSLCAMALALAGCEKGSGDGKKYNVSITNKDAIAEIFEDDTSKSVSVQIDGVITADAYQKGDLVVTSSNTDVLEISGNNKLSPIEAGTVTVTATYKKKFKDSVDINVKLQKALQPVANPQEGEDYVLSMVPKTGVRNYAVGGMSGYYLKSGTELEEAATARVLLDHDRGESPYKYKITLTWKDGEETVTKTIGGCKTSGHTNIGFVEDASDSYPYVAQYFKVNQEDISLSTMIDGEEFWIGTYSTYYTFSFRNASQIQYKSSLFGYLDPIHAETVSIDQEDVKIKAGGIAKLSATLTPSNSTDIVTWYSKNQSVATVDAATGLVIGKAEGTAEIVAKARPRHEDSIIVTVEGALDYGTEEQPLSVTQAKALLDDGFADGEMTPENIYVTGTVSSASYNSQYSNWTIWLYDGETAEGFELYATELGTGIDGEKLLDGAIVKAYGLGKIMTTSSGAKIYELSNKGSESSPKLYSCEPAELTGIEVDPDEVELNIHDGEQTKQFSVKPLPAAGVLPETVDWAVAPTGEGAFITDAGLLTVHADAVAEGGTKTYTVTAIAGNFSATSTVTVKNEGAPTGEVTVTFAAVDLIADPEASYTGGSVKLETYKIDEVATVSVTGGSNSGKVYKSNDYGFQIRLYDSSSDKGVLTVTVAEGYEITAATAMSADGSSSWWGQPSEVNMTIAEGAASASISGKITVYSVTITYQAK